MLSYWLSPSPLLHPTVKINDKKKISFTCSSCGLVRSFFNFNSKEKLYRTLILRWPSPPAPAGIKSEMVSIVDWADFFKTLHQDFKCHTCDRKVKKRSWSSMFVFLKLFCENSHPFWCYMSPQYSSSLLDPRDRFVVVFSAPLHPKNVLLRPSIRIGILWLRWHRPILFHNRRPHLLPRNRRSFHDWSPCNDRTRPSCEIYDCWQLLEECMVICSSPNT